MNARLAFENAQRLLMATLPANSVADARLTPSYIRAEVVAQTNTSQYQIQTLVNQNNNANTIFSTERRLALQDWFVVSQIGVFIACPSSATDTTFKLLTYPDPVVMSTSGAAAANYVLYNGYLALTIDNKKVMPEWQLDNHLYIPPTQAAANADYATSGITLVGERNGSTDGYYPCEPNLVFNGAATLDFTLNLPAAISTLQSANQRIVVILKGHKAQNVTNVK